MARYKSYHCLNPDCRWPLLDYKGRPEDSSLYENDDREPRKRHRKRTGHCELCGDYKTEPKSKLAEAPFSKPPQPCPKCGAIPNVTFDHCNDECFVACMSCGEEGPRLIFPVEGSRKSRKERTEDKVWYDLEKAAKRAWAMGRRSRKRRQPILG